MGPILQPQRPQIFVTSYMRPWWSNYTENFHKLNYAASRDQFFCDKNAAARSVCGS